MSIQELKEKIKFKLKTLEEYYHPVDDESLHGSSDDDYYSSGEISGQIHELKSFLIELDQLDSGWSRIQE